MMKVVLEISDGKARLGLEDMVVEDVRDLLTTNRAMEILQAVGGAMVAAGMKKAQEGGKESDAKPGEPKE